MIIPLVSSSSSWTMNERTHVLERVHVWLEEYDLV